MAHDLEVLPPVEKPDSQVLVINPGSTSTKLSLYERRSLAAGATLLEENVAHRAQELESYPSIAAQFDIRRRVVEKTLATLKTPVKPLAVVGRGGLIRPGPGGIYAVNKDLLADLEEARYGEHASNLGAMLAFALGESFGVPAYIADPVGTDELLPEARLSGFPGIERRGRAHTLNMKACARAAAEELGRALTDCRFVVAHLGGGTSIGAVVGGRIVDVNDALLGMGPMSTQRAGALPIGPLVELAYSGRYTREELLAALGRRGGFLGYLGTDDAREVLRRADAGDAEADLVHRAMVHQVTKEIGGMAVVAGPRLDGIILTGGLLRSRPIAGRLTSRIGHLARVFAYPGEHEMSALATAGFRALAGAEPVQTYRRAESG